MLRPDQQADLTFLLANPRALLLHEPGCGKTPTVCVLQYARWLQHQIRTIWIQPKSLMGKNRRELLRFTPLKEDQVVIVDGPKAEALAQQPAVIYLMGPDRFKLLREKGSLPPNFGAIDVDEFHMCFKGAESARTTAFLAEVAKLRHTVMMTGTLIDGGLSSAWAAIHAIEPKYYPFGYKHFLQHHAVTDEHGKVLFWKNHSRISQILGRHGLRRTFSSIFGDQEIITQADEIEMHPRQRELFDEIQRAAILELEEVMIDGTLPGVMVTRARQIMEHPEQFPDPRGGTIDLLKGEKNGKLQRLEVHFEDHLRTGKPLIVFSAKPKQQQAIHQLATQQGLKACLLDSRTNSAERDRLDRAYQAGQYQVMVASPQIAGIGFNWQFWGPDRIEVDHVINACLSYLDTDYIQSMRRAIRQKRTKPLRVTNLQYIDSLDQAIAAILRRKSIDANLVDPTREILAI